MCGRFQISVSHNELVERFYAEFEDNSYKPQFNIAPSAHVPIILNEDPKLFQMVKWGLRPSWAKKDMINARAETIDEKPMFKKSFQERRCIIPSTGFYEWKKGEDGKKLPYYIGLKDKGLFSFAGIWSENKDEDGKAENQFVILTTEPNELTKEIHNRMPVMLFPEDEQRWLMEEDAEKLLEIMSPYPADEMVAFQISDRVNNPLNNTAAIINPL